MLSELKHLLAPAVRFFGHSLAAAIGFAAVATGALSAALIVRLCKALGVDELVPVLQALEFAILYADIALYAVQQIAWSILFLTEIGQVFVRALRRSGSGQ